MTLAMPDSTEVGNLPPGYDAYLGYIDGKFNTEASLRARFPAAQLVLLTVTGGTLQADGCDVEPGNLAPGNGCLWVRGKLVAEPGFRPVIYASVSQMPLVLRSMNDLDIERNEVRLLSAHYGEGAHICGPRSCGAISTDMDGTQWTAMAKGLNGTDIDMSMLADDFFGPAQSETERLVRELGIVRQGDTGAAVWTVQGLCHARRPGAGPMMDGIYGPETKQAVEQLQGAAHLTADGVVGPLTWPVLLGVA